MRLTVSLDDALVAETDRVARAPGVSRSRLIADALEQFLRRQRQAQITQQLNRAYAGGQPDEDRVLVRQMRTKLRALDRW